MAVEQSGAEASPAPEAAREDTSPEAAAPPDLEDTKRKFREALERKQASVRSGSAHENAGGKNQHAHGPAANKRTFRRKSG